MIKAWTFTGVGVAAVCGTVAACSGSSTGDISGAPGGDGGTGTDGSSTGTDGSTPGADGSTTGALKCDALAKALCEKYSTCTKLIPVAFGDVATCVTQATASCQKSLAATGVSVTQAEIDACATAEAAISCDDLFANKPPSTCRKPGALADGAACGTDGQCKSSHCRKGAPGANCGTCGKEAASGETCARDEDCTAGLNCNTDKKCAPLAKETEACGVNGCAYGLKCFNKTCVKALAEGANCTRATDNSDACDLVQKLDYCGLTSNKCEALTLATKAGDACGVVSGKFVLCAYEAKCTGVALVPGVCEAARVEGAACSDTEKCKAPYTCDANKCILQDPSLCK